jgi:hypothetical protein
MQPGKNLPAHYVSRGTLDLSKDTRALVLLNLGGLVIFFVAGGLLLWFTQALRPGLTIQFTPTVLDAVVLIAAFFFIIVLHEAVHGVFFWLFTRERPVFGFRGLYAFAAAPEWYLPRNQYLVVGMAPLVLITLAGLVLIAFLSDTSLVIALLILAMHAGGAIGDLFVTTWCLRQPATILVRDVGDAMTIYAPAASSPSSPH